MPANGSKGESSRMDTKDAKNKVIQKDKNKCKNKGKGKGKNKEDDANNWVNLETFRYADTDSL